MKLDSYSLVMATTGGMLLLGAVATIVRAPEAPTPVTIPDVAAPPAHFDGLAAGAEIAAQRAAVIAHGFYKMDGYTAGVVVAAEPSDRSPKWEFAGLEAGVPMAFPAEEFSGVVGARLEGWEFAGVTVFDPAEIASMDDAGYIFHAIETSMIRRPSSLFDTLEIDPAP